jgi:toxin ParE1/3/4
VKRKFVVRPLAEIEQANHFLYLGSKNPAVAHRFLDAIEAALARIRNDPGFGAKLPFDQPAGRDIRFYRPKGFDTYVIVFRVTDDAVIILRVLHGSQDIEPALADE